MSMRIVISAIAVCAMCSNALAERSGLPKGYKLQDRIVAVVDDKVITLYELERSFAPVAALGHAILDEDERRKWFEEKRKNVLEEQVSTILVLEEAKKLNLEASPRRVQAHINSLKTQNNWSPEVLENYVKRLGFRDLEAYREHVEKEMVKAQIINVKIGSRVKAGKEDIERIFKRDFYGGTAEDEIHAQHILIRIPTSGTPPQLRALRAHVESIRATALSEEKTFADLAREFSSDKNAAQGGNLGWFKRGELHPDFERAAFALETGQISEVVRTQFGYHIIRVVEHRKTPISNSKLIKRRIQMELEMENRLKAYESWVKELRVYHHVNVRL